MAGAATESITEECIAELVKSAVLAPSPDNNQPWRFTFDGERLEIRLDTSRTLPSDVESMFSLMSLGAAIENLRIAATQHGLEARIVRSGSCDDSRSPTAAAIEFVSPAEPDPLFPWIARRCTNRKPFSKQRPSDELLRELSRAAEQADAEARIDWLTERKDIAAVSHLIAGSDRIRMEYEGFHREIFRQLRFSAQHAEKTRDGLDVRTLELPWGAARFLKFLGSWRRMQALNRLGLSRLLAWQAAAVVGQSGAIGVLSAGEAAPADFLAGGRAFQRLWLTAQANNLSLHPLGSLPILLAHLEIWHGRALSQNHNELLRKLGSGLRSLVPALAGRRPLMLFRIGQAAAPRVRSLRRAVVDVIDHLPEESCV